MIQIIRQGNLKEPVMRFVCPNCGCVFEADRESYKQCFTSCPCCKNNVSYEESLQQIGDIYDTEGVQQ